MMQAQWQATDWRDYLRRPFMCLTMEVTPAMAAEMLTYNRRNRRIRPAHVKKILRDMQAGRWVAQHPSTIAFDMEGVLIDGQQRLTAITCLPAETRVLLNVMFGCNPSAKKSINTGRSNSLGDVAWMANLPVVFRSATEAARAMSTLVRFLAGPDDSTLAHGRQTRSESELVDRFLEHEDAILWSVRLWATCHTRAIRTSATTGCFARAYYHLDVDLLTEAAEVLRTGEMRRTLDVTLVAVRNWQIQRSYQRVRHYEGEAYRRLGRALRFYAAGRVIRRNLDKAGDPFPLPPRTAS